MLGIKNSFNKVISSPLNNLKEDKKDNDIFINQNIDLEKELNDERKNRIRRPFKDSIEKQPHGKPKTSRNKKKIINKSKKHNRNK